VSTPTTWTIPDVRASLDARKISARELVKEFYARIERRNAELNIYLALSPDRAYAQADKIDAAIAAGDALPALAGVPIAVKDVISTHPGGLQASVRCHGRHAPRTRWSHHPGQNELR
jgi:Asp-tRNA(Asn)/Glu-tRNA(Gln) amidotransferase A subunit family amidase